MRASSPAGDEGVAALELALVMTVLLGLFALVAPLPVAMAQKSKLEQAAARTSRWATSVPSGVRPTRALLPVEAEHAFVRSGGRADNFSAVVSGAEPAPQCPRRLARTVTLTNDVDLGPFGDMLRAAGITSAGSITLTARATSCEE